MKKMEWVRESVSGWPNAEYVKEREAAGWRIAAVEWEREVEVQADERDSGHSEQIPYGMQVAADGLHLEENPVEMEILNHLAEMIVQDVSYNRMADALNQRPCRTREGYAWTPVAVFKLTPRLIEVAPRILSGQEWDQRKKNLSRVAWNS